MQEVILTPDGEPAEEPTQIANREPSSQADGSMHEARVLFQEKAFSFELEAALEGKGENQDPKAFQARHERQVKRGQIVPEGTLDLHGQTRDRARGDILHFLEESQRMGRKVGLIVHGKGTGALRDETERVLGEVQAVKAYFAAPLFLGGNGAKVVLVRS